MTDSVESLTRRRLPDLVADQVLESIASGRFKPGGRLPSEPELARQMGVGRTSLREAIQKLRTLGVVEVRKGLGTYVVDGAPTDPILSFAAWSTDNRYEVAELLETRMALELAAAPLAAERAPRTAVALMKRTAKAHIKAERSGSLDQLVRTDQDFHTALVQASHNSLMIQVYGTLVPPLAEYRRRSLAIPSAPTRSGSGHMRIVDAVEAKDPPGARAAMLAHLWPLYEEFVKAAGRPGHRRAQRTVFESNGKARTSRSR